MSPSRSRAIGPSRSRALVVAVGTTRQPKLDAVELVLRELRERFPDFLPGELGLEPRQVPSGAPSTPTSTEETMRGARNRARNTFELLEREGITPALSIGLEGGIVAHNGAAFLESWSFVADGHGGFFGGSGSIPLPDELSEAVLVHREDLGAAADRYFERLDVAGHEGTFGLLTQGMVSRKAAFVRSMLHALAPFYNAGAYRSKDQT